MEEGERSRGVAAYRTSGLKATSLDRLLVDHLLVDLSIGFAWLLASSRAARSINRPRAWEARKEYGPPWNSSPPPCRP
jgi:hypothetical protein